METTQNDQHALLRANNSSGGISKNTLTFKRCIVIGILVIIILIVAILAIFVFDLFNLFHDDVYEPKSKAGMFGLWPAYGGGLKNQQTPPYPENVTITSKNIQNVTTKCIYESDGGVTFMGYPSIDNINNTYFTDANGYITSINLDTCQINWKQHVGILLGFNDNITLSTHQSLTIFRDSNGTEGILFGAPSRRGDLGAPTYPDEYGCYALAVYLNNGSFWWKIQIGQDYKQQDYLCTLHGFYVDGIYGYGGFTQSCCYKNDDDSNNFIGRFVKINIDTHAIVDVWYPFEYNLTEKDNFDEYNLSYAGISSYNYPAIDDDYVVFGTSNLWILPYKIQECMLFLNNNSYNTSNIALNKSESVLSDICGNDKSSHPYFRCLSNKIYPSSLIILNKNTFELKNGYRFLGIDVMRFYDILSCNPAETAQTTTCPGYYFNSYIKGFNGDLTAVSIYFNKLNNKKYVIAVNKAAILSIFELESGELYLTKKYGPQTTTGQFNIAIDEESMIGITTMTGGIFYSSRPDPAFLYYDLPNGNLRICEGTGVVIAFDLNTGKTLWQVINPYGTINESICYNDTYYENSIEYINNLNSVICEKLIEDDNNDDILIHIPPKSNITLTPIQSKSRAKFRGAVTIINEMVFIPSDTGDIFVHNLYNGSFIHRFICPNQNVNNTYNRAAIKGGISIVNNRIVVHCGGDDYASPEIMNGNQLVSMQLDF